MRGELSSRRDTRTSVVEMYTRLEMHILTVHTVQRSDRGTVALLLAMTLPWYGNLDRLLWQDMAESPWAKAKRVSCDFDGAS